MGVDFPRVHHRVYEINSSTSIGEGELRARILEKLGKSPAERLEQTGDVGVRGLYPVPPQYGDGAKSGGSSPLGGPAHRSASL